MLSGLDPLRILIHRDGLARFATAPYTGPTNGNLKNLFMHLTNYAINKESEDFQYNESETDDGTGHKRSLEYVYNLLRE